MLNLTGLTNTDLKLEYGAANLDALCEYDNHFTTFVQTIPIYARELIDAGQTEDARELLELAVSYHADASVIYTMLADIYQQNGQAVEKANQFSNVHFHFINYSRRRYKIYMYLRHVLLNRFHYNLYVGLFPFLSKARKIVKQENFDIVVIENRLKLPPLVHGNHL